MQARAKIFDIKKINQDPQDQALLTAILKASKRIRFEGNKVYRFPEALRGQGYNIQTIKFNFTVSKYINKKSTKDTPPQFNFAVYSTKKFLGEGGCGKIYPVDGKLKFRAKGITYFPIDKTRPEKCRVSKYQNITTLRQLKNQTRENSILRQVDYMHAREISFIYKQKKIIGSEMIMAQLFEYDLFRFIDKYDICKSPQGLVHIFFNATAATLKLHQQGITHADIKPDNIMIDPNNNYDIKFIDFGFSRILCQEKFTRTCGTVWYMAPEMLVTPDKADKRIDTFSLGSTLRVVAQDPEIYKLLSLNSPQTVTHLVAKSYVEAKDPRVSLKHIAFKDSDRELLEKILQLMNHPSPEKREDLKVDLYIFFHVHCNITKNLLGDFPNHPLIKELNLLFRLIKKYSKSEFTLEEIWQLNNILFSISHALKNTATPFLLSIIEKLFAFIENKFAATFEDCDLSIKNFIKSIFEEMNYLTANNAEQALIIIKYYDSLIDLMNGNRNSLSNYHTMSEVFKKVLPKLTQEKAHTVTQYGYSPKAKIAEAMEELKQIVFSNQKTVRKKA